MTGRQGDPEPRGTTGNGRIPDRRDEKSLFPERLSCRQGGFFGSNNDGNDRALGLSVTRQGISQFLIELPQIPPEALSAGLAGF